MILVSERHRLLILIFLAEHKLFIFFLHIPQQQIGANTQWLEHHEILMEGSKASKSMMKRQQLVTLPSLAKPSQLDHQRMAAHTQRLLTTEDGHVLLDH